VRRRTAGEQAKGRSSQVRSWRLGAKAVHTAATSLRDGAYGDFPLLAGPRL